MSKFNKFRRYFLSATGLLGAGLISKSASAYHTESHFDESSPNKLVYQCNKADSDYIDHILFSCSEMIRKYGDDIEIVFAVFGPGLHLLAKKPQRAISKLQQDRVQSLSKYGVAFHACGNTMKSLGWDKNDLLPVAKVVTIGVDDLMRLQKKGFAYVSW